LVEFEKIVKNPEAVLVSVVNAVKKSQDEKEVGVWHLKMVIDENYKAKNVTEVLQKLLKYAKK